MYGRTLMTLLVILFLVAPTTPAQVNYPDLVYLRFNEGFAASTANLAAPGVSSNPILQGQATWLTTAPKLGAASLRIPPTAIGTDCCTTGSPFWIQGDWTIEMWFQCTDPTNSTTFLLEGGGGFRITRYQSANLQFTAPGYTGFVVNAVVLNVWTHIAYTYDSVAGQIRVYKDGNLIHTAAEPPGLPLQIAYTAGLHVGGSAAGAATPFKGNIDEFRFWNVCRSQADIAANMNSEMTNPNVDVTVLTIQRPKDSETCIPLSTSELVRFRLRNSGWNTVVAGTTFMASFSVGGGPSVQEPFTVPSSMQTGDWLPFTFAATADVSAPGSHTIDVSVSFPGDSDPADDSLQKTVVNGNVYVIGSFPWYENFDSLVVQGTTNPPFGWSQDQNDATGSLSSTSVDWYFRSGTTPTLSTGPNGDATTGSGFYGHVEDSAGNHPYVQLISPCIDLGAVANPQLAFQLHSYNSNPAGAFVEENFFRVHVISYPGGAVTMDVFGPFGHDPANTGPWSASSWHTKYADLSAFAGQVVQLVFSGSSDGGGSAGAAYHDIAIDDVAIFDPTINMGQPGQSGVAVLDINNSVNFNVGSGDPYSGAPGPFRGNVAVGGTLSFTMSGEPFQPVGLFYGPLNVGSATYPNVGQTDVGGPVGPIGTPTLLAWLANGFVPVSILDALFRTGAAGDLVFAITVPPLPSGPLTTFQAIFATNNGYFLALSNAVELSIL